MAFSFGPRAGGEGGGGSANVGFAQAKQSSTAETISWSSWDTLMADGDNSSFHTPSFRMTNKASALGSINFGCQIRSTLASQGSGDLEYQLRIEVRSSTSANSGFGSWGVANILDGQAVLLNEVQHYSGETTIDKTLSGEIPFALSTLTDVPDARYIQFRIGLRVSGSTQPQTISATRGHIAFTSFGVGATSTDVGPNTLGITENASEAGKAVVVDTAGTGFDLSATVVADDGITRAKVAPNAIGTTEIEDGTVTHDKIDTDAIDGTNIADNAVGNEHIAANAVRASEIQDGAVGEAKLASQSVAPLKLKGITSVSGEAGQVVAINSSEDGFELTSPGSSGGGVPANDSITNAMLKDNIITNAKMADDSVGANELIANSVTADAINNGAVGTNQLAADAVTPDKINGVDAANGTAGQILALNSAKDGFTLTDDQTGSGGGVAVTLATITGGPLALNKGGTGYEADNIEDLRSHLNVASGGSSDFTLVRSSDANTQKDNTLHRFDSSTSNIPTGTSKGILIRNGNDQYLFDEDGEQWKRTLSNTNTNTPWTAPVDATISGGSPDLKRLQTESDFRTFAESDQGWTDTTNWLPQFLDGSRPAKVIVGRNGNYLVAIDRNNMFWAPRPTVSTWTEIPWRWEGNSNIPAGLEYTGGEADERLIPAGEDAVISGKTGIPGENFITLLVDHSVSGSTSTFTGYYVDDNNAQTLKKTTNTIGNTAGTWTQARLGIDSISTDIFVPDTDADGNERPAFVGVVPAISDLHFADYTYKTSLTGISEGDVAYIASSRTVWIYHKTTDIHLPTLFAIDYEVSIHKDDSNQIRGVFDAVNTFPLGGGVTLSGGVFRAADLNTQGTIASGDTVSIRGHKAVLTKTDAIDTVNLADDAITNAKIADDAVDTAQIADNAITPALVDGVTASGNANMFVKINSTADGFTVGSGGGGGGGGVPDDGSVTTAKLADDAVTIPDKVASVLTALTGTYSFQGYNQVSEPTAGQIGASSISNGRAQIQFQLHTTDTAAKAHFAATGFHTNNEIVTLTNSDRSKYLAIKADTRNQVDDDFGITGDVIANTGTFATNESVTILYGQRYGSLRINAIGKLITDNSPSILGLTDLGTSEAGKIVTLDDAGNGFTTESALLLPSSFQPAISKSRSYTVINSGTPTEGQVLLTTTPIFYTPSGSADETFMSTLATNAQAGSGTNVLVVKDANNYATFRVTGNPTQASNFTSFSSVSGFTTIGSISANDTVRVWLKPANAGQIIQFDNIGENAILVNPVSISPVKAILRLKQTTAVTSFSGDNWSNLNTQTGAWQMQNKSSDYIEFNGRGTAYCSAGSPNSINVVVGLIYRYATTESGLSTASWSNHNFGLPDGDDFFRSKLYAGNTNNAIEHRDYGWATGNVMIPLSDLSGVADGNFIQFSIRMRRENTNFQPISSMRSTFLSCKVYDKSIIHSN